MIHLDNYAYRRKEYIGMRMKLHIMTWNCSLYAKDPFLYDSVVYNSIVSIVKERLAIENSLVILQEIPYKCKSGKTWMVHPLYEKLLYDFPKEEYKIVFNVSNKYQIMMTVAIASKDKISSLDDNYYSFNIPKNRMIAVNFNGVSILGIHAENGDNNKYFLDSLHDLADIILGDFNAGDYPESENRKTFNQILKGHICICNMPTKITKSGRRTCIDHVFVRENMVDKCSNLIVHEEIKLSDHFPITFEYEIVDAY